MLSPDCHRGQHGQCPGRGCDCPCHNRYRRRVSQLDVPRDDGGAGAPAWSTP